MHRYREPDSLYLYVIGIDHTPLTDLLKERCLRANPVTLFSHEHQYFIEIFDWLSQNEMTVTNVCAVLWALINRHPKATVRYQVDGQTIELTNINPKSAVELARELIKTQAVRIDLSPYNHAPKGCQEDDELNGKG